MAPSEAAVQKDSVSLPQHKKRVRSRSVDPLENTPFQALADRLK